MDDIVIRYTRQFLKPLTNITYEVPMKEEFYINQLKSKIDDFGFPANDILPILQSSPDTFITGSFLLHYLTSPTDWHPNDIDVFTTDPELYKKLEDCMKPYTKARFGFNNVAHNGDYPNIGNYIDNLYEWESNVDNMKKFQIILIKDATANDVIDKFDLDIVKSRFDGHIIIIPHKSMKSLVKKEAKISSTFATEYNLNQTIERVEKYKLRGYTILFPLYISIESQLSIQRKYLRYNDAKSYYDGSTRGYIYVAGMFYEIKNLAGGNIILFKTDEDTKIPTYDPVTEISRDDIPMA